jgi:hypothetical protein
MPSREHNTLVELFRDHPSLAPSLLAEALHAPVPPHQTVAVVESSLDQLIPVEFRADLVLELRSREGALLLAIVIEVQLTEDYEKLYSWPTYLVALRARKRCPVCLLVVTPNADIASWASLPIQVGLDSSDGFIQPRVLGPAEVPRVTDPTAAQREPHLSVLSALAHGNEPDGLPVVSAALAALGGFDMAAGQVYLQVIYEALGATARRALEKLMESRSQEDIGWPPFVQKRIDQEKAAGRAAGEAAGEAEGLRRALLKLVTRAGIQLRPDERARIDGESQAAVLDHWLDNALTATSAAELFIE